MNEILLIIDLYFRVGDQLILIEDLNFNNGILGLFLLEIIEKKTLFTP